MKFEDVENIRGGGTIIQMLLYCTSADSDPSPRIKLRSCTYLAPEPRIVQWISIRLVSKANSHIN